MTRLGRDTHQTLVDTATKLMRLRDFKESIQRQLDNLRTQLLSVEEEEKTLRKDYGLQMREHMTEVNRTIVQAARVKVIDDEG